MDGLIPNLKFNTILHGYGTITYNGILVTSKIQSTLYKHITVNDFITALGKNIEVPEEFITLNINWWTFGNSRQEATDNVQKFIIKWLSVDTVTGRVMKERKARLPSKCSRCNHADEHLLHVLTCNSEETIELRDNLLYELLLWLESVYTSEPIIKFVKLGLSRWSMNQDHVWDSNSPIFSHNILEDNAFRSQLKVG